MTTLEGVYPTTVRYNAGTCPACRAYLWADVDLSATVYQPTLSIAGEGRVVAQPVVEAMRLSHECTGRGSS